MFKKFFIERRKRLATRRGLFYFEQAGTRVVCDPLLTYCALKEIGLDTLDEQFQGLKQGDSANTRAFTESIRAAFSVDHITALDLAFLYQAFLRYLNGLKKNVSLLRDFAPDLEARLARLSRTSENESDSPESPSLSGSTLTERKAPPPSDLPTTTEQTEPSTASV